jgi:hypothetical protein
MRLGSPAGWRQRLGTALARLTWRRLFVRVIAAVACLVALVGLYASARAYREVDRAEAVARGQLGELSGTFRQVAASLRTVAASADHAAATVGEARGTLGEAAATTRNAAGTLDETAKVINFTVPFTTLQPLAGVDTNFRDTATQLRALATSVDATGGTLGQNAGDLRAIGRDTGAMAGQLDRVADQLGQLAGAGPGPSGLTQLTGGTRLILAWSVVVPLLLLGLAAALYLLTTDGGHPPGARPGEEAGR